MRILKRDSTRLQFLSVLLLGLLGLSFLCAFTDTLGRTMQGEELSGVLYPFSDTVEGTVSGYLTNGNRFTLTSLADPEISFSFDSRTIACLKLVFSEPIEKDIRMQVFWAAPDQGMSDQNSVRTALRKGSTEAVIRIPACVCDRLRIHIHGPFALEQVLVNEFQPVFTAQREFAPGKMAVVFLGGALLFLAAAFASRPSGDEPAEELQAFRKRNMIRFLLIFALFALTVLLAVRIPMAQAPDEKMRFDVPLWIYRHGRLPIGNEEELVNDDWGFSYAFLPYLPSLLSVPFMALFHGVYPSEFSLLFGARYLSVAALIGSVLLCFKVGDLLFRDDRTTFCFASLLALLPQCTFLGAYHNNDMPALFTSMLILYTLLQARRVHWTVCSCVKLGLAFSLPLLTYYNAAGWIPVGTAFCIYYCLQDDKVPCKGKTIARSAAVILVTLACTAGIWFARNAWLYGGDFLGVSAMRANAAQRAASGYTVHLPESLMQSGESLWGMLIRRQWILTTLKSLIAGFGCMDLWCRPRFYVIYCLLLLGGAVPAVLLNRGLRHRGMTAFLLCSTVALPVVLSVYRSYTYDFQPQGRYLLPALPAIALMISYGFGRLDSVCAPALGKLYGRGFSLTALVPWLLLCLYLYAYLSMLLPKLILS